MRVTFLVAALGNGGGIRVLAQYANGLKKLGHDVQVVCPAPIPWGRLNNIKNYFFGFSGSIPENHFTRLGVPIKMLERYRPIRASDVPNADVIIATWWETAKWMSGFSEAKGKKLHFVQDYEIWNGRKKEVDETLKLPIPKVTISTWIVSKLNEIGVISNDVITNGIDKTLFYHDKISAPKKPTIGFVFTDNPRKGSDIAFEAIFRALKERTDFNILCFGHFVPSYSLTKLKNLTFIQSPDQSELRKIYSSCSAWLFPSREEGFGLPILEAMSCGTPVIACPAGAAPDILKNGGGTLLKSFDPVEMANEIIRYIDMPQEEWRLISANAEKIASKFEWSSSIKKFEKFLLKMA
jgi:glycosyltransferase involved in cell wall biosynthesis